MAECNGCGACCHPFQMIYSPLDIERLRLTLDPAEYAFYTEHLTPMPRKEARALIKHWAGPLSVMLLSNGEIITAWSHYYRCDLYDLETGRCGDYENRPDVCRSYPWYGEPPDPKKALPPTCSYLADVGMPVADPVVRRR